MTWKATHLIAQPGFRLPALTRAGLRLASASSTRTKAVHYDTVDLRLAHWRCTLRREDSDHWIVAVEGRDVIAFNGDEAPPAAAIGYLRAYHRGGRLQPRISLRVSGRKLTMQGEDGAVVRLDDERVVTMRGTRTQSVRRLAVSSPKRSRQQADSVVALLRHAGAHDDSRAGVVLWFSRVRPELVVPKLSSRSDVAAVIQGALSDSVIRLVRNDGPARLGLDPEGVHQARVATRRLRSDLRTFSPLLDSAWVAELRDRLAGLARPLGAVRDADVMVSRLSASAGRLDDPGAAEPVLAALRAERDRDRATLLGVLDSPGYTGLLDALVVAAARPRLIAPSDGPAIEILAPLVHTAWRRLERRVRALPHDPSDDQLHTVRIAAKRARYAAEALIPCAGGAAARLSGEIASLQTHLGDLHDTIVATAWLKARFARRRPGAVTARALIEMQLEEACELRATWKHVWSRVNRKALRRWLTA